MLCSSSHSRLTSHLRSTVRNRSSALDVVIAMADIAHKSTLTRRRFLQWIGGAALTAGAIAGYIRLVEPRWLSIEHFEIPIPGLSPTLDGKRIAQLSDIHLSRYFSPERLASALQEVERQAPAWLMLTGDFVGNH